MYTGGFLLFLIALAIAEQMGMSRRWIGYWFLFATIALYAGIGIMSRTMDAAEYYVAGRRVPAFFNGMATGADWMSAASFIGMAGTLYLAGFDGLAFVMGWTGGYVLVALFLAPYLRKFGQFTIPDFLGERYGGNIVRSVGIFAAILCSFTYVVAQIYGVGIITSRMTGLEFGVGVFVGLGGILVCSFLGGMRAVTWTQVAQYIILIIAYITPVVWLSLKYTGNPIPQIAYGQVLQKVTEREKVLTNDPKEIEVRNILKARADAADAKLKGLPGSYATAKAAAEKRVADLKAANAPAAQITAAEKALTDFPADADAAKALWTTEKGLAARAAPPKPHATPFPGATRRRANIARNNFLGIVFCMMFGTAALPHILMRYYTTPSVREARNSVFWSLFFIFLLYFTAPALAVLAKFDVYTLLVGSSFAQLPAWAANWAQVDPTHAVDQRHQRGRHRAARRDRARHRHHRARHARDRRPAVRRLRAGGRRRSRGGAVDGRRPAADDRQRAVARPLLQDDRPAGHDEAPRHGVEDAAAGRGGHRGLRDVAQAGQHPVPGRRGVLARGLGVLPRAGAGRVLEARQQVGRDLRHGRWDWVSRCITWSGRIRSSAASRRTSGSTWPPFRPACSACRSASSRSASSAC